MTQFSKIVATIGPASKSSKTIAKLIDSGVSVFRCNLKHNSLKWHSEISSKIRRIAKVRNVDIALIADLQGPELRTGSFSKQTESINLTPGQEVILSDGDPHKNIGKSTYIPFAYTKQVHNIKKGSPIFIDDGAIQLKFIKQGQNYISAVVLVGGNLGPQKSVSIPSAEITTPTITTKDAQDIDFAIKNNFEFIALSFVRNKEDVIMLREMIRRREGEQKIISKIETLKAVENFDEILKESDAIMFARGDLGIEIPLERLPKLQKEIIKKCRNESKPVIVATQMLKSMVSANMPTRAEVADIANAVFDKTDALMLSEETATGDHPIKAVTTMSKIARYNENYNSYDDITKKPESYEEIIISASIRFTSQHPEKKEAIKGYVVFTESGKSARMLSRFRPSVPIYAFTQKRHVASQLALSYGVEPFELKLYKNPVKNTQNALEILKRRHRIEAGDRLIVIFGNNVGVPGANNNLSVVSV